jgi:hypothetical protein
MVSGKRELTLGWSGGTVGAMGGLQSPLSLLPSSKGPTVDLGAEHTSGNADEGYNICFAVVEVLCGLGGRTKQPAE